MKNYIKLVKDAYKVRHSRNLKYSLRAFARDIGMSSGNLSLFLSGKKGISKTQAEKIGKILNFSKKESDDFCDEIEFNFARSKEKKSEAKARIHKKRYKKIETHDFYPFSQWQNACFFELARTKNFRYEKNEVAEKIGITVEEVENILNNFIALEFMSLDKKNKIKINYEHIYSDDSDIPSEILREGHKAYLEKAIDSIYFQSVEMREIISLVSAIDTKELPRIKNDLKKFIQEQNIKIDESKNKDSVYCLNISLFKMIK